MNTPRGPVRLSAVTASVTICQRARARVALGEWSHGDGLDVAKTLHSLVISAGFAWLGSVGMVVMRATEAWGSWATTAAVVLGTAASTATLAAIYLATLPGILTTWEVAERNGRRLERAEHGVPAPRRHLTTVR